jgi:hypothetical protein
MTEERIAAVIAAIGEGAWSRAPREGDRRYAAVWKRVSVAIQQKLRVWVPELYFADAGRYEDRRIAHQYLVYQASRVWHGTRTEFTFDCVDPQCLKNALTMIGRSLQDVMAPVESRLRGAGLEGLASRYAPVFYEDVRREVLKKPTRLVALLAEEASMIDAVIDLGTSRTALAAKRFLRIGTEAARRMTLTQTPACEVLFDQAAATLMEVERETSLP